MVIPLATLACSQLLGGMVRAGAMEWIPWLGGSFAIAYLAASFGLLRSFSERRKAVDNQSAEVSLPIKSANSG
jgi:hypothetical protein